MVAQLQIERLSEFVILVFTDKACTRDTCTPGILFPADRSKETEVWSNICKILDQTVSVSDKEKMPVLQESWRN